MYWGVPPGACGSEGAPRLEGLARPRSGDRHPESRTDQDIGRLDVQVHSPRIVNRLHPAADLSDHPQGDIDVQRRVKRKPSLQTGARDVLHHEVRRAVMLAEGVDGHHILVSQARHRSRLAQKTNLEVRHGPDLRTDQLDRDIALQRFVERKRHLSHRPLAQHRRDPVLALEQHAGQDPHLRRRCLTTHRPVPIGHGGSHVLGRALQTGSCAGLCPGLCRLSWLRHLRDLPGQPLGGTTRSSTRPQPSGDGRRWGESPLWLMALLFV